MSCIRPVINAYNSYFNGFSELVSSRSSADIRAVAFLKVLSLASLIIPLGFFLAYTIASSLKGRVKVETKPDLKRVFDDKLTPPPIEDISIESDPLQNKLHHMYQSIRSRLEKSENPYKAHRASSQKGVTVKFGMQNNKSVYIETFDKFSNQVYFTLLPNGGKRICAHWNNGFPSGVESFDISLNDLPLLEWVMPIIDKELSSSNPETIPFFEALVINSTKIKGTYQEENVGGYDWKEKYSSSPLLNSFAKQAQAAVLACRGTFSNYQKIGFKDPISGKAALSAEHLFHFYKFPPDSAERDKILFSATPDQARKTAASLMGNSFGKMTSKGVTLGQLWGEANKNLMVYIQLAKALEPKTKLMHALIDSGAMFILEDTSSRKNGKFPEKFWGDNGDGTGENKLGWAQMEAREYMLQLGAGFSEISVQDYYHAKVKPMLDEYYLHLGA